MRGRASPTQTLLAIRHRYLRAICGEGDRSGDRITARVRCLGKFNEARLRHFLVGAVVLKIAVFPDIEFLTFSPHLASVVNLIGALTAKVESLDADRSVKVVTFVRIDTEPTARHPAFI